MSHKVGSFSLACLAVTLAGCAHLSQLQSKAYAGQEFDPAIGSAIELTEVLLVPPGRLDGWFNAVDHSTSDLSLTNLLQFNRRQNAMRCGMRLAKPVPHGGENVRIEKGTFTVVRIVRESNPLGIDPSTASMHENFATDVKLIYRIDLQSGEQPQVASLYCIQRHAALTRQDVFQVPTI